MTLMSTQEITSFRRDRHLSFSIPPVADDQPSLCGLFPYWQPRAGGAPSIHDFSVRAVAASDERDKVMNERFKRFVHSEPRETESGTVCLS